MNATDTHTPTPTAELAEGAVVIIRTGYSEGFRSTIAQVDRDALGSITYMVKGRDGKVCTYLPEWLTAVVRPTCGYCARPATLLTIDGEEEVCKPCAKGQTDGDVDDYTFILTSRMIARHARTGSYHAIG